MRTLSPFLLSLVLLNVDPLQAQQAIFDPDLRLGVSTYQNGAPTVVTEGRGTLHDAFTGARLFKPVIMGLRLADIDLQAVIGEARFTSQAGEASGSLWKSGVIYHCYDSAMSMHANDYNLHEAIAVGPVCAEPPPSPPREDPPDENCPVILDLGQDGFHLSGPDPAVLFDIDADGVKDLIAWTSAGDDDAFLCLDRNGNGRIDDGTELFGYATPLRNGQRAKVGYRALAELDSREEGGNHDGVVDASDARFADLCVWVDRDRDGVSQLQEISGLSQVGVVALEYRYRVTRLRDSYGNLFRYVSEVQMRTPSGELQPWPSFDVIFTEP